jgi:superfamily II DNA/RNA helicase
MTTSFEDLGVPADLADVLAEAGITSPFPVQALTIPDALTGVDVCGKAKTGSGKTLAFGIPLVLNTVEARPRRPRGLILVPTRELAVQVKRELDPLFERRGLRIKAFYGGTDIEKQIKALKRGVDVIVATPGRLIDLVSRREVSLRAVRTVVIDEADRMADMGFQPQVEWLIRRIERSHQTMLFSATLDGDVDGLVQAYMNDPVRHEVESESVTVDAMTHRFLAVHHMDKVRVAAAITRGSGRALLFVRTKRGADRLADDLKDEGVKVAALHGDLRQSAREKALQRFTDGSLPVLVATDVAARGIHVDDVDVVIHFDPPDDHKNYLHRSGRTARAGESGVVVTLVLWDQELQVRDLQRRLGLDQPIVEMFSNDPRLADLAAWDPTAETAVVA